MHPDRHFARNPHSSMSLLDAIRGIQIFELSEINSGQRFTLTKCRADSEHELQTSLGNEQFNSLQHQSKKYELLACVVHRYICHSLILGSREGSLALLRILRVLRVACCRTHSYRR